MRAGCDVVDVEDFDQVGLPTDGEMVGGSTACGLCRLTRSLVLILEVMRGAILCKTGVEELPLLGGGPVVDCSGFIGGRTNTRSARRAVSTSATIVGRRDRPVVGPSVMDNVGVGTRAISSTRVGGAAARCVPGVAVEDAAGTASAGVGAVRIFSLS